MRRALISLTIFILISSGVYANALKLDQKQINSENISVVNQKSWVLMIYLDGDNNLDEIMEKTIQKIEEEGYCDNVKIFIQFDSYDLFEGIKRYEITDNGLDEIEAIPEKSMGNKTTLVEFVSWCKQRCNADRYCLVLSDHGTGWMNGFLLDETDEDKYMSMDELRDTLIDIKNNILHQKIDLLVLDACLMGMTEIYYQIRDTTKVCVASPELHSGCPYKWILWDLYDDAFCDEKKLGQYFVESYKTEYSIILVAAYDIEKISTNVSEKLNAFSDELIDKYNSVKEIIKESIDRAISYNGINPDGSDYVLNYKDLHGFTFHLSRNVDDVALQNKAEDLMNSLRDAKVYPHTNLGISIYLPTYNLNKDYRYKPEYKNLDLCQDTSWDELVEKTRSLIKIEPMASLKTNFNLFRLISYLLDFDNF